MSNWWKNPSRSAVIYDRRNNRHIQPGETTTVAPDPMLVRTGRLIAGSTDEPVVAREEVVSGPVTVVSSLVIEESVLPVEEPVFGGLELADEPVGSYSGGKKRKK